MYKRILLAYDGSEEGRRALLECANLAGALNAAVHLLAVMPVKDFKPVMDLWLIYPHFLGNLQGPVDAFGKLVAGSLQKIKNAA